MKNSTSVKFDGLVKDPVGALQVGEVIVNAEPARVWEVVGDFHGFQKFITGLNDIEAIGQGVRCLRKKNFSDGNVVVEQLNSVDNERFSMTWSMIYTTFDIGNLWSRMRVIPLENASAKVVWEIVGEPCTGSREQYTRFVDEFLRMAMGNIRSIFKS